MRKRVMRCDWCGKEIKGEPIYGMRWYGRRAVYCSEKCAFMGEDDAFMSMYGGDP